jgi:hypothetical protein
MTERPEDDAERPQDDSERTEGEGDAAAAAELNEPDSPGAQPDATDATAAPEERTTEGGPQPEGQRQEPVAAEQPQSVASPAPEAEDQPEATPEPEPEASTAGAGFDPNGKPLLVFLNEVAGGRKLLQTVRDRVPQVSEIAVVSPQNQPHLGAKIPRPELREAALSRVEVTMSVFAEFGLDSVGDVMDPDPMLALDDAVRAFEPGEVLLSALPDVRIGLMRKDLVEWARRHLEPEVKLTHIPVRVADDAVRWDVTHTLVVATKTVNKRELVDHLLALAKERAHRFTFICPRSEGVTREEVSRDLAATLAEMYRADIDATGQPMSPEPFYAVQNAIENYRIDEILISTLEGQQSKWLDEGLIDKVRGITEKPVIHVEGGRVVDDGQAAVRAAEERRDPVGAGERS